jgi:glycosyltransferase involved in cell wall biosynthesis
MHGDILIVSHTFPPVPGIGGRRWAKFAKYLSANGNTVRVLSANKAGTGSLWKDDVKHIPLSHWQHFYPEILDKIPSSVLGKFLYRAALICNRLAIKGNPYDRSGYDRDSFTRALFAELSSHPAKAVIITAPPFGLLTYVAEMKQQFSGIRFIADMRDPWTSGVNYGYNRLTGKRAQWEHDAERLVVKNFDAVTSPWPDFVTELKSRYPEYSGKIYILPHAFDRDDVIKSISPSVNTVPHIIYGGNTYSGFDEVFKNLRTLADKGKVTIEIFSDSEIPKSIGKGAKGFEWNRPISPRMLFEKAAMADYLLFLIPETLRNGLPTKLYEYAATGKPLFATGLRGTLQELIEKEGLGIFVESGSFAAQAETLLGQIPAPRIKSGWADDHELSHVTKTLLTIIQKND